MTTTTDLLHTVINDEVHQRTKAIATEADARLAWTLPLSWVIDMVAHDIIPNGVPMSGDHRRFAAGGRP